MELERDDGFGRVRAASYLTILNTDLGPEELERLVGLAADETWKQGDPRRANQTQSFNGATYESGLDELAAPWDHVAALLDRLAPYAERIASIAALPSTRSARVWVVEHTERDNIDTILEPAQVALVAAMHAELAFSSYFYDGD
jgi:hypothetical protein